MDHSLMIVGYLLLFALTGLVFVGAALVVGWFVRPNNPSPEKQEVYECGEPAIGSSFVQYDLRFYVVALVFIIFDVEVAFLFPWAVVFGKAVSLADPQFETVTLRGDEVVLTSDAELLYRELGVRSPAPPRGVEAGAVVIDPARAIRSGAKQLVWLCVAAVSIFFAVLMVGFAYEWKTGAFDWVRAVSHHHASTVAVSTSQTFEEEPAPTT